MQNQQKSSAVGIIVTSAIITMLILAVATFFIFWKIIPLYQIPPYIIYSFLTRLLPLIIGLTLVLLALAIAVPNFPLDTDDQDVIEKDLYTMPLYNLPLEDEQISEAIEPLVAIQAIDYSTLEDKPIKRASEFEIQPFEATTPECYQEELILPIVVKEDKEIYKRLTKAVSFADYPYPYEQTSSVATLLEPIGESSVDEALPDQYLVTIEDSFESRLVDEMAAANELNYQISIAHIKIVAQNDEDLTRTLDDFIDSRFIYYKIENNQRAVILPFYSYTSTQRYLAALLNHLHKHHPQNAICIGFSAVENRNLSDEQLIKESLLALDVALQRGGYNLIGYDDSIEQDNN